MFSTVQTANIDAQESARSRLAQDSSASSADSGRGSPRGAEPNAAPFDKCVRKTFDRSKAALTLRVWLHRLETARPPSLEYTRVCLEKPLWWVLIHFVFVQLINRCRCEGGEKSGQGGHQLEDN